jgi:hypothetical protein
VHHAPFGPCIVYLDERHQVAGNLGGMSSLARSMHIARANDKFQEEEYEHEKAAQYVICIDGGLLVDHAGGCQKPGTGLDNGHNQDA